MHLLNLCLHVPRMQPATECDIKWEDLRIEPDEQWTNWVYQFYRLRECLIKIIGLIYRHAVHPWRWSSCQGATRWSCLAVSECVTSVKRQLMSHWTSGGPANFIWRFFPFIPQYTPFCGCLLHRRTGCRWWSSWLFYGNRSVGKWTIWCIGSHQINSCV